MGGGYFQFFTENRPQKHKKHAILHTSQANGGGSSPPRPPPPPGYATDCNVQLIIQKTFALFVLKHRYTQKDFKNVLMHK